MEPVVRVAIAVVMMITAAASAQSQAKPSKAKICGFGGCFVLSCLSRPPWQGTVALALLACLLGGSFVLEVSLLSSAIRFLGLSLHRGIPSFLIGVEREGIGVLLVSDGYF